jgi:carbamoyl-phosphate synthase large subunit
LDVAIEVDVDAVADGHEVIIGGIMQHVEQAGIHSGDSGCSLPPYNLSADLQRQLAEQVRELAMALKVVGLMNTQFAIQNGIIYVLEVNPRASRTIPFVSKTIGKPLASLAARVMLGETLAELGYTKEIIAPFVSVKEAVFPFAKFREFDPILGPEMRSTGEVMGISDTFGTAFAKAQLAAGNGLPESGRVMLTVNDHDKAEAATIAKRFAALGFGLVATEGTARYLQGQGVEAERVFKVSAGRPNGIDLMVNGTLQLLINTPLGKRAQKDDYSLRQAAIAHRVPYTTTLSAASAACDAIESMKTLPASVRSLQEWQETIG